MGQIWCVFVKGIGLSTEVQFYLFCAARKMFEDRLNKLPFECSSCEGRVTTKFEYSSIGSVYGIVFDAEVDQEKEGKTQVRYIVRPGDIESGTLFFPLTVPRGVLEVPVFN